ncbi:hypothetical protein [Actinocorallia longicatena]|uniref:Uncharacterized protein n=1 Tax=Actinocorallia longicatena TaxID=111803 RepID=A0ABP6QPB0_9ACTN
MKPHAWADRHPAANNADAVIMQPCEWHPVGGTTHLLTRLNRSDTSPAPALKDLAEITEMRLDWVRERFADPRYANEVASIKDAEDVLATLLATTTTQHVLHADLQAKNVLTGPDH